MDSVMRIQAAAAEFSELCTADAGTTESDSSQYTLQRQRKPNLRHLCVLL